MSDYASVVKASRQRLLDAHRGIMTEAPKGIAVLQMTREHGQRVTVSRLLTGPSSRLFLRFFAPFALISALSLLFGLITYRRSLQLIEAEVSRNALHVLDEGVRVVDALVSHVGTIVDHIATNRHVADLRFLPDQSAEEVIPSIVEARHTLYNYPVTNDFIEAYFVLLENVAYVLSPGRVYTYDFFFDHVLRLAEPPRPAVEAPLRADGFLPSARYAVAGGTRDLILLIHNVGVPDRSRATILVTLDTTAILELFSPIDTEVGEGVLIFDRAGVLVAGSSAITEILTAAERRDLSGVNGEGAVHIGERSYRIFSTRSVETGWTFLSLQPFDVIPDKVAYIRTIALLSLTANLVLGMVIALHSAYSNSRPLAGLLREMEDALDGIPGVRHRRVLRDPMRRIVEDSSALRRRLEMQSPIVRTAFVRRVLSGGFAPGEATEPFVSDLSIDADEAFFGVLCVQPGTDETSKSTARREWPLYRAAIEEVVGVASADTFRLIDVREYAVNVVVGCRGGRDETRRTLENVAQDIRLGVSGPAPPFSIGIGGVYRGLWDVHRSFSEAHGAARHAAFHGVAVQRAGGLPTSRRIEYSVQLEEQLITCACAGKIDRVRELLRTVRERNVISRDLGPELTSLLMHDLMRRRSRRKRRQSSTRRTAPRSPVPTVSSPAPETPNTSIASSNGWSTSSAISAHE